MLRECHFEERKHEHRFTNQNADDIKIFWVCNTDKTEPYVGALHQNTAWHVGFHAEIHLPTEKQKKELQAAPIFFSRPRAELCVD